MSRLDLATSPLIVSLETYGKWQLRLFTASDLKDRVCLILLGVDKSFDDSSFLEELWISNKHIWGLEGDIQNELIRLRRLNRHDGAKWIPYFTYAFWVKEGVATRMLEDHTVFYNFEVKMWVPTPTANHAVWSVGAEDIWQSSAERI